MPERIAATEYGAHLPARILIRVPLDLLKFTTADENGWGSHGERFTRAVGFRGSKKPTLPANIAVSVATKDRIFMKAFHTPPRGTTPHEGGNL